MRVIKIILATYFGILSLVFLRGIFGQNILSIEISQTVGQMIRVAIWESACLATAAVCGVAWWTILRKSRTAKRWALAASSLSLLISIAFPLLYYFVQGWSAFLEADRLFVIPAVLGFLGLLVFTRSDRTADTPKAAADT